MRKSSLPAPSFVVLRGPKIAERRWNPTHDTAPLPPSLILDKYKDPHSPSLATRSTTSPHHVALKSSAAPMQHQRRTQLRPHVSLASKHQRERQSLYDITPHKHDRVQGASAPAICEIISKRSCVSCSCAPECQSSCAGEERWSLLLALPAPHHPEPIVLCCTVRTVPGRRVPQQGDGKTPSKQMRCGCFVSCARHEVADVRPSSSDGMAP